LQLSSYSRTILIRRIVLPHGVLVICRCLCSLRWLRRQVAATHICLIRPLLQGYALDERLLEFRCNRYFYVEGVDTFLPVPDVPKDFNRQLRSSAAALAATQDPR
jgi:hypothetical protein